MNMQRKKKEKKVKKKVNFYIICVRVDFVTNYFSHHDVSFRVRSVCHVPCACTFFTRLQFPLHLNSHKSFEVDK